MTRDEKEVEVEATTRAGVIARTPVEAPHEESPDEVEVADESGLEANLWSDAWRQLRHSPLFLISAGVITLIVLIAIFPQLFTGADPRACNLSNSLVRPSSGHIFGYDLQGCDYYARVIYGTRVSISIGLLVTSGATLVALVLGALAGYYGATWDTLLARLADIWFAIPFILAGIVFLSVLGEKGLGQVSLVLVVFGWPTMFRLLRSSILSTKQMDYVRAARALGASDLRIIVKHILPNALAPLIVYATITIGIVIAAEATLSFLGVGLQLPAISWGLMISIAQNRILQAPHLLLFPGLFLSVTVLAFIMLGDALREAFDPKLH